MYWNVGARCVIDSEDGNSDADGDGLGCAYKPLLLQQIN